MAAANEAMDSLLQAKLTQFGLTEAQVTRLSNEGILTAEIFIRIPIDDIVDVFSPRGLLTLVQKSANRGFHSWLTNKADTQGTLDDINFDTYADNIRLDQE